MKTDKELLELAAKAAGVSGEYVEDYEPGDYYADRFYTGNRSGLLSGDWFAGSQDVWNPLESDGDALRLAVKLRMDICIHKAQPAVQVYVSAPNDELVVQSEQFDSLATGNELVAMRRAIVKAAAAIGSKK